MENDKMNEVVKKYTDAQTEFLKEITSIQLNMMQNFISMLTQHSAIFKVTVQSNGRITIPEAEREALKISEGDLVQVILIPLGRKEKI
jgi:AbrB family looped-hinge helix DNA binding protein